MCKLERKSLFWAPAWFTELVKPFLLGAFSFRWLQPLCQGTWLGEQSASYICSLLAPSSVHPCTVNKFYNGPQFSWIEVKGMKIHSFFLIPIILIQVFITSHIFNLSS